MGSCISSPDLGKEREAKHVASPARSVGVDGVKAFATTGSTQGPVTLTASHKAPGSMPPDRGAARNGNGQQSVPGAEEQGAAAWRSGMTNDTSARPSPVPNAATEAGSPHPLSAQPSPPAAASPDPNAAAKTAAAPFNARSSSSSRRQGPNVPRRRGSTSNLRRGGAAASRRSSIDDGVALPLTAAQMNDALDDAVETPGYGSSAAAPPPPPAALDSTAADDSASSTSTVRSRNASYSAGGPEGTAAAGAGAKPSLGSGLSRLGFGGPAAAAAATAALMDAGPGSGSGAGAGRGAGAASSRDVPRLAGGGGGGEESDAVPDLLAGRQARPGERSGGNGAPLLGAGISVPLPPPGGRSGALPFSASMPHGPQGPGQLQAAGSAAPPPPSMQRDASAFRFDPALLASLRLTPSASVSSTVQPADSLGGQPGAAGPGPGPCSDHLRPPGAAHHLSFTHHAGRPQGHPSGAVTCSEDTDTDGRPSESGPSYTGPGCGVAPRKASFSSRPPLGPNSGRRRGGGEGPQPRPSSGAHQREAVAAAAANQVAALLQNPLPSIPSGGLTPGAGDPGIQTLLSLGLVNAAAYRRARQRASEAGGAAAAGAGGCGGGGAGSGPQSFAYHQQVYMQAPGGSPGGPPGLGMPGRKVRRSSCTEAYAHQPYVHPQGYGYGAPRNRQLQQLGTMSRAAEGANSSGSGSGRSHLNADAAFGMVRRTASVAVPRDAQAAIAAAAAAAAALTAEGQAGGGNSGRGRQRRASYSILGL
ncbi:hypothetical protein HYH02_008234 [Chlamydomonas schloesseri]|uniref:Uncharacterized protein n=1 Tax=Chlamydomonas schloesseri TaxID=2026947 RepID=A0A836B428_9CHLO|nr:hypothetical protein HYH02_008234 [Chlamydomonas schloesseri]|eukprot:KAG2446664.1 hypothetical protein HYH02_008234 [Chlamydomonas schloesseri]